MEEPICKKCGGGLVHNTKSSFWTCKKCGNIYDYVEPGPSDEQIELRKLRNELAYHTDQAMQNIQVLMGRLREFNPQIIRYLEKYHEFGLVLSEYEQIYQLLDGSMQTTQEWIKSMDASLVPLGGGHFEDISIVLDTLL